MRTYYRIEHDFPPSGRWYLNGLKDANGNRLDLRDFTHGLVVQTEPAIRLSSPVDGRAIDTTLPFTMSLRRPGPPLDFTFGDFEVPIVTQRVSQLLAGIAGGDIQFVPVTIAAHAGEYSILNVTSVAQCIDLSRSDISFWTEEDGLPDMIGKPQMISELIIDPLLAEGRHLLRPAGWKVALLASDAVKTILEAERVTGITFQRVSY